MISGQLVARGPVELVPVLPGEGHGAGGGDVPQALGGIEHLIIAEDEAGRPAAFMGIENRTLEMLFLSPEERGRGLGKRLLQYGMENYGIERLTVNEQNPQGRLL